MKPNIALVGKMGSGKTTIANALAEYHGYKRISWADGVRYVASLAYGPIDYNKVYDVRMPDGRHTGLTGRQVLQRVGTEALRNNVDQDFWIKALSRRLENDPNGGPWVIDDSRFDNEAMAARAAGWLTVHVKINEDARLERIHQLYPEADSTTISHSSENSLTSTFIDIAIWNTTPDVRKTVDELMQTAANYVEQQMMRKRLADKS
jgi:cytidylate kinase